MDSVEHDLELTVSALKDGPSDLGLRGGLLEVERWQRRIDATDAPALEEVGAALAELRGELESDDPDSQVLTRLLRQLGESSVAISEMEPEGDKRSRLAELGNLLIEGAAEVS